MSFMHRLFGQDKPAAARNSQPAQSRSAFQASEVSRQSESPQGVRRELLRLVLRETLKTNGMPADWIAVDAVSVTSPVRGTGMQVRLTVRHWDDRLPQYLMAFQQNFEARLLTFDPMASQWLMGFSWHFDLPADAVWPRLPEPATWAAPPQVVAQPDIFPPPASSEAAAGSAARLTREQLEREFAADDQRFRASQADFAPTEAFAPTEPGRL